MNDNLKEIALRAFPLDTSSSVFLRRKWLLAIEWMRSRPRGSIWVLDGGRARWHASGSQ